jgi:AcrR family transcriptional regulator
MPQQQRSEETRARIIGTAFAVFARNGYETASVAEICDEAGLSKGAFYHHFPSKQAVFQELIDNWLVELDVSLRQAMMGKATVPERFYAMARLLRQVFKEAQGSLPIFLEFWEHASRNPEEWEMTIIPFRRYTDFMARIIQEGIDEGSLKQVDPQTASRALVSLAVGLLLQGLIDANRVDWGQVAVDSIEMFFKGLEK